jgi:hypothetical protein
MLALSLPPSPSLLITPQFQLPALILPRTSNNPPKCSGKGPRRVGEPTTCRPGSWSCACRCHGTAAGTGTLRMGFGLSGAVTVSHWCQHRLGWVERLARKQHFRVMAQLTVHITTAGTIRNTHDDGIIKRFTVCETQGEKDSKVSLKQKGRVGERTTLQ